MIEEQPGRTPISDFGLYHFGTEPYRELRFQTLDELVQIVAQARNDNCVLRVRGGGHSLNGGSVPRRGERMLRTDRLRHFRCESPHTITVGSGVPMWDVRDFVAQFGYQLPVVNNGSAGPTVGGLIAAGGLGPDSVEHGGLWCNVASLVAVDGRGQVVRLRKQDDELAWWFGAMGQLGVIYEAELELVPTGSVSALPHTGSIPAVNQIHEPKYSLPGEPSGETLAYWVTIMTSPAREAEALADLAALEARHAGKLEWLPVFTYRMAYRGRVAPLVYPLAEDFLALFCWGKIAAADPAGRQKVETIEHDFAQLVASKGYRRYHQTELTLRDHDPARYYADAWPRLLALLDQHDPERRINPGALV